MADEQPEEKTEPKHEDDNTDVEPEIIRFDNNGDLRLLVSERTVEGPVPKIFIVSSKAMSMACDAWNSMLNGSFRESQPPPSGELREVELPNDDAAALKISLNIAHLHFDQIPSRLEFLTLSLQSHRVDR
ncbi:hypothetical protein BKA81DRAFT_405238 [Phyllosticta paracitricarpa]|uniref:Uncharacterized protein n=1 Tax=Phyllosticta paracitricarpa TaxID=2016321 RepID=A0ABR1NI80_9PEZI